MAAGFEDAYQRGSDLAGGKVLAVGYGSGDAAEAIPMTVAPTWREAASLIGFEAERSTPTRTFTQAQYESPARHRHGAWGSSSPTTVS